MTIQTELQTVPTEENALQVYSAPNGLDPYLALIRAELDGFIPNVTTKKGRAEIASIAAKVAKSKTALDGIGKELVARLKDVPKKIDGERKRMRDTLDAWKDEVRKPLTDWEEAEQARIANHEAGIEWFRLRADENSDLDAAELAGSIAEVEARSVGPAWEEFEAEAHRIKARALESLKAALATRQKYDDEQAELARLRQEAAERAEQDRLAEVARQAVEAERVRAANEQQAQRDADALRIQQAEQATRDAEAREQQAEANRKAAEQRAEQERIAAEQRASEERQQAEVRQQQAADQARQEEQDRQQRAADEEARQQQARQADTANKVKVLGEAKTAIMELGVSEQIAKCIVLKIARGEVPNVTIKF